MPLNPKVVITATGIHGHCWFAGSDILSGEWIWRKRAPNDPHTDLILTRAQIAAMPTDKREKYLNLCYQIDDDLHCGFNPDCDPIPAELIEDYINHSCNSNSWYTSGEELVARELILKGTEITYDYCLTECNPEWILADKCLCESNDCRGLVTGNDWKLPELQQRYGEHFYPHILKKIKQQQQQQQSTAAATAASSSTDSDSELTIIDSVPLSSLSADKQIELNTFLKKVLNHFDQQESESELESESTATAATLTEAVSK